MTSSACEEREKPALEVTIHNTSDAALKQEVAALCSACGRVKSVRLCRVSDVQPYSYVLVEMLNVAQNYEVARAFGGSSFRTCALLHLRQKDRQQSALAA